MLQASTHVSNPKVAFLQFRRGLAPCGDVSDGRGATLGFGAPLNPMIGKSGVPTVLGISPWHVASDAIAVFGGMRGRELLLVASQASRPVILHGLRWLVVWVVAGPAPQSALAVPGTRT